MDAKKHIDLTYLRTVSKGNVAFEQKMLDTFINQAIVDLGNLKKALANKDWEELYMIAHKMKPSLHFVGLDQYIGDILSIELYAKQKSDNDQLKEHVSTISNVIELAVEESKEELEAMNQKVQ